MRQVLKPQPKNLTAAMVLTALAAPADALLPFYLAGHQMPDMTAFVERVRAATAASQSGQLVTFGVQPRMPSTAYGHI